jgi:hypothetical protein
MKQKPIVTALAFAALFFGVLLPPEAYPDGKLAVLLCATFAFFISIVERRISTRYLYGGLFSFGILLAHTFLVSVDVYRSLDFLTLIWSYYCLAGFFLYAGFEPLKPLAWCMVGLSVIVSGYGLYQYFWGFDRLYTFVFYSGSDQVVKVPALDLIANRRVFSTLALPGTLWGFLVIALPLHAALWRKNWLVNTGLIVSAALLLTTGFLTRSFGFLLGLLVLAGVWLLLHHRRVVLNKLTPVAIALAVVGGTFYWARRGVIEEANPAGLRLYNWISAWTIFATHPFGTGGNTFGVMYPRYMLPNANETQYTHNTLLQLLSEFGFPIILLVAALLLVLTQRWNRLSRRIMSRTGSQWVLLAAAVWFVHNLVDINVYFGSLGVLGAVVIGTLLWKGEREIPLPAVRHNVAFGALSLIVVAFASLSMVSTELQHRAQAEYEEHKYAVAVATLDEARAMMPLNSSLFYDAGEILLDTYSRSRDAKQLTAATDSFRRAIALSPMKVGPHIGLGLCLSWTEDKGSALKEIRTAEELYPDSTYVQSIVKLMVGHKPATP